MCEKCASAIMSLILVGENPGDYGFQYNEETLPQNFAAGMQQMAREGKYDFLSLYYDIQAAYRLKYTVDQVPPTLRLFYDADMEALADFLLVPNNECIAKDAAFKKEQGKLYWEIGQLKYKFEKSEQLNRIQVSHVNETPETADGKIRAPEHDLHMLEERLRIMEQSTSWRMTKPFRYIGEMIRRIKSGMLN